MRVQQQGKEKRGKKLKIKIKRGLLTETTALEGRLSNVNSLLDNAKRGK